MLNSLFGDLGLSRSSESSALARAARASRAGSRFAATAMLESQSSRLNERGEIIDRHVRDLFVTGSAAQAMRDHFATSAEAGPGDARMITLFDPAHLWAPAVIKTLSDAGGRPVERLNLREHTSLRTLATIERTAIQPAGETLKVYHADIGSPASGGSDVAVALLERSDLATVIVGRLHPQTIDTLLENLRNAASQPTWHCRTLLFMLPPAAVWMASKVASIAWPQALRVLVLNEPMTSASSVWNSLLAMWNQVKQLDAAAQPGDQPVASRVPLISPRVTSAGSGTQDPTDERIARGLLELSRSDGLAGYALVNRAQGTLVARGPTSGADVDLESCVRTGLALWRDHEAHADPSCTAAPTEELIIASARRDVVVRPAGAQRQWLLLAVFDRQRAHPALARQRVADAQAALAG